MTALATIAEPSELVASVERARALFEAGDVQAALLLSSGAYEQAKAAGGYAQKVKASRELVDKARRMQGEALKIESICYVAMADAVDAAQAKGELSRGGRPKTVSGENGFTLEEVGIDRQRLHQARKLRNAERATPGFIDRVVEARLEEGLEPSRASLKQAAGHTIGTKTATKDERGEDLYETPAEAMRVLLALESFSALVKEPSVGKGAILKPLEDAGYEVMIADLVDRGMATKHGELQRIGDFRISVSGNSDGVDIVTNPPFGIANSYAAHALRVHKPGKMALLLNLNFMCGFDDPDRAFVMDENPPSRVYVFTRRLPMMHRDGWDGPKASSQMNTAWFVWERNDDGSYGKGGGAFETIRVDWQDFQTVAPMAPGQDWHRAPEFVVDPRVRPEDDDSGCQDEDLERQTVRRSLDERVEGERFRALVWIGERESFDAGAMRRGLGLRGSTVDALIESFLGDGLIEACEDGYRITDDGWLALKACAGALVGLAVIEAVNTSGEAAP